MELTCRKIITFKAVTSDPIFSIQNSCIQQKIHFFQNITLQFIDVISQCVWLQPYLRQHHIRDNLNDRGLLTDDGRVVVNVKDYNEFRRYLRYYNVALAVSPVNEGSAYVIMEDCSAIWLIIIMG